MMIGMMTMLLCVRFSVFVTTSAAFLHSHKIMPASHELGFDQQVFFHRLSRKLMLKEMVEGYEDQDLVFYNDQRESMLGETQKDGEEVMANDGEGSESDPAHLTSMDYSHARKRRPIHNNSSSKTAISP